MAIVQKRRKTNIKDFSTFCSILDHALPVCVAYVCDISYMCYIDKCLKYIYRYKIDKKKQCIQIFSVICCQMKHLADSLLSSAGIHG